FDEGSGTIAYDRSGYNNNGTLINGPTWQTETNCKVGKCLSFDGVDDYVVTPDIGNLGNRFTVMGWVYKQGGSSEWRPIILKGYKTAYRNYTFRVIEQFLNYFDVGICSPTTEYFYRNIITFENNQWISFALTYDGSSLRFYKNSNLAFQNNLNINLDPYNGFGVKIGGDNIDLKYINALIDEIRIYNKPLSNDEIRAILK
ncbi:MAG: LamG domain-containing protein, partial [Patescibacteria group bacterium]|nr:LamG domain-containing protein [Patescibacteria group bacterium]